jgi:pimeloyl-ACP methyl ester carboxylesterase
MQASMPTAPPVISSAALSSGVTAVEPTVHYRIIHGYRRAFVDVGSGPVLLLIHGIGDSSNVWRDLIPDLARDYRVIAPDLLGHGRSAMPRADYAVAAYANGMRDLLSVLDVERATIVGHSLGGGVAMQFAYQYPERCERIVLVCTGGVCREVNVLLRIAAALEPSLVLSLLAIPGAKQLGQSIARLLQRYDTAIGCDAQELLRVFETLPDVEARHAFFRTLRGVIDFDGQVITMLDRCYLGRGLPTLIVWGARDVIIPLEHGKIANDALPGSRLEVFENSGHFPHRRERERFLALLREFVSSTVPASYDVEQWRSRLRAGEPYATNSPPSHRISKAPSSRPGRGRD